MPTKATRVIVLLTLLAVVAGWAAGRTRARRARVAWDRPVTVAVFLSGDVGPGAASALQASLDGIADRLAEERDRHAGPRPEPPIVFQLHGPLHPERSPPTDPPGGFIGERALHAFRLWRAERAAFAAAGGFDPDLADVRVHVAASAPAGRATFAEGIGAAGGDVGVVRAAIDDADGFLPATAVAHEALHCLGATDKYDAAGHAVVPDGLPAPTRTPPYPQDAAEIMAGEVALGPGAGRLPIGPEELAVGAQTAREIGWLDAAGPAR